MKYLIVGLGNPGDKYENTRHNIGFKVLEELISGTETKFQTAKGPTTFNPSTYSGQGLQLSTQIQ